MSVRASAVAAGIAPMPSCSVAPSGTSSATCSPIRRSTSPMAGPACVVRRDVDLDREVDVVDVDEALAERPRHRPVELDDDGLRRADRRVHRLDARAQRAEAVGVGRCRVDEDDVERQRAALEQPRHVRQEDRHVVRPALVHRGTGVRPDEQRPVAEVAGHLRREVRPGTLRVQVDDRDVVELGRARDQLSSSTDGVAAAQCTYTRSPDRTTAAASSGETRRMRQAYAVGPGRDGQHPDPKRVTFGPVRGRPRGVNSGHGQFTASSHLPHPGHWSRRPRGARPVLRRVVT